jgi:hypothetical protein
VSESFKDAIQAAARAEPAVGDPYERFLRRRKASRGLRTMLGVVVFALTMFGFVRVFPGGTGATPNDGFIPGAELQPGFDPYQEFEADHLALAMLIPAEWQTEITKQGARVGPSLADSFEGVPNEVEVRFGQMQECASDQCVPLHLALSDPTRAQKSGVSVIARSIRIGPLTEQAIEVQYPNRDDATVAPWCSGCAAWYSEIGPAQLPMFVVAPDLATLREHGSIVFSVLETLQLR